MIVDWRTSVNWNNVKIGLTKYNHIMDLFSEESFSDEWTDGNYRDFRRSYNHFYRMRRNDAFQKHYFDLLIKNKNNTSISFNDIFSSIKENTGRIEASFASKLLATISPDMPVWDSEVLKKLGKKPPASYDKERVSKIIYCYDSIFDWYQRELTSSSGLEMIQAFDKIVGKTKISSIKKIDFILWQKDR